MLSTDVETKNDEKNHEVSDLHYTLSLTDLQL